MSFVISETPKENEMSSQFLPELYDINIIVAIILISICYCGISLIPLGQCSWIVQILLVRGDVISWVTGFFLHYNARRIR